MENKNFLLSLSRQCLEYFLEHGKLLEVSASDVPESLRQPGACFVTLKKNIVELRGCMGHLSATQALYLDVIENAVAAGFQDSRFFPLTKDELSDIEIEISVLTEPKIVEYSSPQDLLDKLRVGEDGVIVERGNLNATYLPQVWDEMLEKHNFISSLCLKAGLPPDDWQNPGLHVYTYQVQVFSESK